MSIRRTIIHGKGFHVYDESLGNNAVIVEGEIPFDNLMEVIIALTEWADSIESHKKWLDSEEGIKWVETHPTIKAIKEMSKNE